MNLPSGHSRNAKGFYAFKVKYTNSRALAFRIASKTNQLHNYLDSKGRKTVSEMQNLWDKAICLAD